MLRASALSISPDDPDRIIAQWGAQHPIGRVGQPGEVADAIVFLVSPHSSFVTGSDLRIDGGALAGVSLAAPKESSDAG
jgi:NAD(P)-dependent dehydrogenase (short-subunit alcohol dehydrogenase family)